MRELYDLNIEISEKKSHDYADDEDAFKNFRVSEIYGIPATTGFMTRMGDKMSRISQLLKKEAMVSDESIYDTLSDLANYAMLLRIFLEQRHSQGNQPKGN